jgi:hypothetical protein
MRDLINAIMLDARAQAAFWQIHRNAGREEYFSPPLFMMPGVELPIVPRIAMPRIEGVARRFGRR